MLSVPLIAAVLALSVTWLLLHYYNRNRNLPPGPWGLPVLGYYPFIPSEHYAHFANLARRYGKVFSFRTVGEKLVVVLNGVDVIKDILINRSEEFIGRPQESNLVAWISNRMGLAQEEGTVWKEHRRFFLQSAKTFGFAKQKSEDLLHEEMKTMIRDIKKEGGGGAANVRFHIAYAANSVVCQILFSKKFDKYDGSFEDIANAAIHLVEIFADERYMLVGAIYEHIVMKLPNTKSIRKARELYRRISKEIIAEHVKTFDPNNLRDYVDAYLFEAQKSDKTEEESTFTIERLESICFNMLMEGTESVGSTMCGLLDTASKYPDQQKIVQEELDSVVGRERLPSWSDRTKLPYLEAFIQELFRHSMPFNISTHYCNYEDTTIQGYRIPSRTIIIANLWTVNNDPALYPEPTKFSLNRFVDGSGKKIKTEGPYAFGIGKRSCVAEPLAQMEVFLITAALMQNFTLYPANPSGFLNAVPRK